MYGYVFLNSNDWQKDAGRLISRLQTVDFHLTSPFCFPFGAIFLRKRNPKENLCYYFSHNGDFIFYSGMFFYRLNHGLNALKQFLFDVDPCKPSLDATKGQFTLLIKKDGKIFTLCDKLGVCKIYYNTDFSMISTSFISLAEAIEKKSLNIQACYEYVWNETVFGEQSFFNEISSQSPDKALFVYPRTYFVELEKIDIRQKYICLNSLPKLLDFYAERLQNLFSEYANHFGNNVNLGVSGGYDSRLLLAALISVGIKPRVFTYGSTTDTEATIATQLASIQKLEFNVITKQTSKPISIERYKDLIQRNYGNFDGWKTYGIFDEGLDIEDRLNRTKDNFIYMNGGIGEIFRNFHYLPHQKFTIDEFFDSFYSRVNSSWCSDIFDYELFKRKICEKIKNSLILKDDLLAREQVEMAYPLFRGRYWTARDVCLNQTFGPCLYPFMEPYLIKGTPDIPIKWKNYGIFQSKLIAKLNPQLATISSNYGFSFNNEPSVYYKARYIFSYYRPTIIRRYSYRIKSIKRTEIPYYLTQEYLRTSIDPEFPVMSKLFQIDKIRDEKVLNRVATLEYILERLNVNF